jgi:hypothetical protein
VTNLLLHKGNYHVLQTPGGPQVFYLIPWKVQVLRRSWGGHTKWSLNNGNEIRDYYAIIIVIKLCVVLLQRNLDIVVISGKTRLGIVRVVGVERVSTRFVETRFLPKRAEIQIPPNCRNVFWARCPIYRKMISPPIAEIPIAETSIGRFAETIFQAVVRFTEKYKLTLLFSYYNVVIK